MIYKKTIKNITSHDRTGMIYFVIGSIIFLMSRLLELPSSLRSLSKHSQIKDFFSIALCPHHGVILGHAEHRRRRRRRKPSEVILGGGPLTS